MRKLAKIPFSKLVLKIGIPSLLIGGAFCNCGQFDFAHRVAQSAGKLNFKRALPYDVLLSEFMVTPSNPEGRTNTPNPEGPAPSPTPTPTPTPTPQPAPSPETNDIRIYPKLTPICAPGEMDIVGSAIDCNIPKNFILTVGDEYGEKVLFKKVLGSGIESVAGGSAFSGRESGSPVNPTGYMGATTNLFEVSRAFTTASISTKVRSGLFNIFACIDGNGNGRCGDEPVLDLNQVSAETGKAMVPHLGPPGPSKAFCDVLNEGLVLFHAQHEFGSGMGSAEAGTLAGKTISPYLNNLASSGGGDRGGGTPTAEYTIVFGKYYDENFSQIDSYSFGSGYECQGQVLARTAGCFVSGTKIQVTEEASYPIERFVPGSPIRLADGRTAKVSKIVAGPEKKPVITFQTEAGPLITVTTGHPLITDKGLKAAKDITIGEKLKTAAGQFVSITSISQKPYSGKVYNVELEGLTEGDHLILAEGLVSGDLHLQQKLGDEQKSGSGTIPNLSAK